MDNPDTISEFKITQFKMPYDSLTLKAVAAELRDRLIGGQVQDIRQPDRTDVQLGIRSRGRTFLLLLSADTRFARVHLTEGKQPNAPTPPSFCMALRKHCEGGRIEEIRQQGFDRILEIDIRTRTDTGEEAVVTLIAELMGRHSNLVLVRSDGVILEAAKRVSHKINRFRETLPGLPYQSPPEQKDRLNPFDVETPTILIDELGQQSEFMEAIAARLFQERVVGVSPFLAAEISARLFSSKESRPETLSSIWRELFGAAERHEFSPVAIYGQEQLIGAYPFGLVHLPLTAQKPIKDLNGALDEVYSEAVERATRTALVNELRGKIDRARAHFTRERETIERALQETGRAEQYRQSGELILANLWQIEPGAESVTVQDYFDPDYPDRVLPLDPKKSPQENADYWFARYQKMKAEGHAIRDSRRQTALTALSMLEDAANQLHNWETRADASPEELKRLDSELTSAGVFFKSNAQGAGEQKTGPDFQGHKIRRVVSPEGYEIYVGETATANDFLTTRLAAPKDIWLHVRASTSAHVIIRTHGSPETVPKSTLYFAAQLCIRHSSQKHSSLVPVDYTLRKYVRKPRGAAPGSADYQHETTLDVAM